MAERWFFYQDRAGLWKWARLDLLGTVLGHSGCSFDTRDACMEHAASNGYTRDERSQREAAAPRDRVRRLRAPRRRTAHA